MEEGERQSPHALPPNSRCHSGHKDLQQQQRGCVQPSPEQRRQAYHPRERPELNRNSKTTPQVGSGIGYPTSSMHEDSPEKPYDEDATSVRPPPSSSRTSSVDEGSLLNGMSSVSLSTMDSISHAAKPKACNEHVRVVVRARPRMRTTWYQDNLHQNKGKTAAAEFVEAEDIEDIITVDKANQSIQFETPSHWDESDQRRGSAQPNKRVFVYDEVFDGDSPQEEVYRNIGPAFVENMISGYNCR